jgi:hypothetical protein
MELVARNDNIFIKLLLLIILIFISTAITLLLLLLLDRNADQYFCWAEQAVLAAGLDSSDVLVIAPKFADADDNMSSGILFWDENDQWKGGDMSTKTLPYRISSFAVMDSITATLADRNIYPFLDRVILAGHSAV